MSKDINNQSLVKYIVFSALFESERKIKKTRFITETVITVFIGIILILPHLFFKQNLFWRVINDVAAIFVICNITSLFLLISRKANMTIEYCQCVANIIISIAYMIFYKQGNIVIDIFALIVFDIFAVKRYAAYLSNINYQKIVKMYNEAKIRAEEYNKKKNGLQLKHIALNALIEQNRNYYKKYADTENQTKKAEEQLKDIKLGNIDDAEEALNHKYPMEEYLNEFCSNEDVYEYHKNMNKFAEGMKTALEDIDRYGKIIKTISEILESEKKDLNNSYIKHLKQDLPEETRQILINEINTYINSDRKAFQINELYRIQLKKNIRI